MLGHVCAKDVLENLLSAQVLLLLGQELEHVAVMLIIFNEEEE